jgi:protein-tyrosine phosphatase
MNEASARRPPNRLQIVFVCTGNRFRSPLAAAYMRRLLAGSNVEISSCGTASVAQKALRPLPEAIEVAASSAIDLSSHRTRWVGDVRLTDADLVVGFERAHVAAAVLDGGAAKAKTFVLGELVALLKQIETTDASNPAQRVRERVARADAVRQAAPLGQHELPDPFGRSRRFYERTAVDVWSLTGELVALLFPKALPKAALPRPRLKRLLGPSRR